MATLIKFRVWFHDPNEIDIGCYIDAQEAIEEDYIRFNGTSLEPTDECSIIEQFTGLHDKNGKEIFEGDQYKDTWGHIQTVEYKLLDRIEITGHGESDRIIRSGFVLNYVPTEIEIIGNIHEERDK